MTHIPLRTDRRTNQCNVLTGCALVIEVDLHNRFIITWMYTRLSCSLNVGNLYRAKMTNPSLHPLYLVPSPPLLLDKRTDQLITGKMQPKMTRIFAMS